MRCDPASVFTGSWEIKSMITRVEGFESNKENKGNKFSKQNPTNEDPKKIMSKKTAHTYR